MSKSRLIRMRIYPAFLFFLMENWLKKMSLQGWHLVDCKMYMFYCFERSEPKEKEYFAWTPTHTGDGFYSITLRYPLLVKTYGIKSKRSKLNMNSEKKHLNLIEVDLEKNDIRDVHALKSERNRLYFRRFIRDLLVLSILLLGLAIILIAKSF